MARTKTNQDIQMVPVDKIVAGPNDRKVFNPVELERLAAVIAEYGPQNWPALPLYRPIGDGLFEIVCGERRTRAMRDLLGWTHIRAFVRAMSDEEASAIMLGENKNRVDLYPIEEAQGYQSRMKLYGWDAKKLAEIAGVSEDLVKSRVSLLSLAEDIQHLVNYGNMPIGHAELMVKLDVNRQRIAIRVFIQSGGMAQYRFKDLCQELYQQQIAESQNSLFDMNALMQAYAQQPVDTNSPLKGKQARTGAPTRRDLPPIRYSIHDTVPQLFDRYIADLVRAGHTAEAAAVGNLYNTLVAHNWLQIPSQRELDEFSFSHQAGEAVHEHRIK